MQILSSTPYLRVGDMQRSLAFYRDALGFEVVGDSCGDDGLFWASLRKDGVSLMISHRPSRIFGHAHEGPDAIGEHEHDEHGRHLFPGPAVVSNGELNQVTYIYVEDVDAAYEELTSHGVDTVDAPEDRFYGVREFLIRDPDGYYYAIAQLLS